MSQSSPVQAKPEDLVVPAPPLTAPVGVIGLGTTGSGMAAALRRAGYPLRVFDRIPERAQVVASEGGVVCSSVIELVMRCQVIICVVPSEAQVDQLLFHANTGCFNALQSGSLFIMCATADPVFSTQIEAQLAERGVHYLDAPVSGGAARASAGDLTLLVSGHPDAMRKADPYLHAMAGRIYRLGDQAGMASRVKIINQLLTGIHIAAAAEALALGLRAGIDLKILYEIITHSAGNSWMFENRMAHVLAGDYKAMSALDALVQDLGLVLDLARKHNFPLPLSSAAQQMFLLASSAGHGEEDDSAVIKIFSGIQLPVGPVKRAKRIRQKNPRP